MNTPSWVETLQLSLKEISPSTTTPPSARPAAVLVTLSRHRTDPLPEVLLIERPTHSRTHAGQIAFPGGAVESVDPHREATALREAEEELGVEPESVHVLGTLPERWVHISNFVVTPVIGYWHAPHPVTPNDREVSRVLHVPLTQLADVANHKKHRISTGEMSPAFQVRNAMIWGFTAGVLHQLIPLFDA